MVKKEKEMKYKNIVKGKFMYFNNSSGDCAGDYSHNNYRSYGYNR